MQEKTKRKHRLILILAIILAALLTAGAVVWYAVLLSPGWHERNGQKIYYVTTEHQKARGFQVISGKPWYFGEDGRPAEKGWIQAQETADTDLSPRYYCMGEGELAVGWKYMDEKVWYFYQEEDLKRLKGDADISLGALARSYTTAGNIRIPATGYIDGGEGLALAYGIDVLNRYGWNLKGAYRYASGLRFVAGADVHYGFRIHKCALQGFEKGKGNCLVWSGTFCTMARLLGKDCRQIWGTLQWKGTRPHSWTEIWEKDGIHIYDPRKNDGEGLAGFDKRYGQKGTYKYDEDSKKYLKW